MDWEPLSNRFTKMSRTDTMICAWGAAVTDHTHHGTVYPYPYPQCNAFPVSSLYHNAMLFRPPPMCTVFLGRTKCVLQCVLIFCCYGGWIAKDRGTIRSWCAGNFIRARFFVRTWIVSWWRWVEQIIFHPPFLWQSIIDHFHITDFG